MNSRAVAGRLALGLVIVVTIACGSNSSTPAGPTPMIAGDWTGTWQFVTSGVTVMDNVRVTFTQTDTATGSWTADNGASGQFQFPVSSSVTGTFTITQVKVSGPTCSATANLSGTVSASAMTLSVPTVPSTPQCAWATNNQFSLHR